MEILDRPVLVLNANWAVIHECTVREALSMMCADAASGMGTDDACFTPVAWKEWIKLPVRPTDECVRTSHANVRAPRVIIAGNYRGLVAKKPRLNMKNLFSHYGGKCMYSGKQLKPKEASREHVRPVSKGGKTTWQNVGLADRDINSKRGNKPLTEAGLKPLYPLTEPRPITPADTIVNRFEYPEWDQFLKKKK